MKNCLLFFITLLLSTTAFPQNYLIAFTKTKGNNGCNDMNYLKLEVKNGDHYYKQSSILAKQAAASNQTYKDYFITAEEFAVVTESTGQFVSGGCTFRKYEFFRSKKSLDDAQKKAKEHYKNFHGLYASMPTELFSLGSGIIKATSAAEKQLGNVHAKFYIRSQNGQSIAFAQLTNNHKTNTIVVKIESLNENKKSIHTTTKILKKEAMQQFKIDNAAYYHVFVSDSYEEAIAESPGFIETVKRWIKEWLVKKEDIKIESASSGVRG